MASKTTENKRYLSHDLADWACGLKYEHLSAGAIKSAKLFWFDSIGCALGGSEQADAKILLDHFCEVNGSTGPCSCFVSGFNVPAACLKKAGPV